MAAFGRAGGRGIMSGRSLLRTMLAETAAPAGGATGALPSSSTAAAAPRLAVDTGRRLFASAASSSAHAAVEESGARTAFRRLAGVGLPLAMIGALAYGYAYPDYDGGLSPGGGDATPRQVGRRGEVVSNWSGTHEARPALLYAPESEEDVEAIVREAHRAGRRLRAVGGALSPNGLGLSDGQGMVSLALLDQVLSVDAARREVTVQAGARVQSVADHLRPLGLTLQNYASIREQHVAGFTQVSAHGTGATLPPADEQVVALRLVTPARGAIDLRADSADPAEREAFRMARCGLGCLGVVTRVTLACVPAHRLVERTFVATPAEVRARHAGWLSSHRHLRYMWLPATDAVVVVQCDPLVPGSRGERVATREAERSAAAEAAAASGGGKGAAGGGDGRHRLAPMRALLAEAAGGAAKLGGLASMSHDDVEGMSLAELRDALVAAGPLDAEWVRRVNGAEAEAWRASAGVRVGWSDEILGFDCGGQQWVLEVAFPVGSMEDVRRECAGGGGSGGGGWLFGGWLFGGRAAAAPASAGGGGGGGKSGGGRDDDDAALLAPLATGSRDLRYMGELLALVRREGIPAPGPIEQRWTAGSASPMSPASRFGGGKSGKSGGGGGPWAAASSAAWDAAAAAAAAGASPADAVHSWVGVIMYLPTSDPAQREAITRAFRTAYVPLVEREMMPRYGAAWHWAKIEPPSTAAGAAAGAGSDGVGGGGGGAGAAEAPGEALARMRAALARRYPLDRFNALRGELDPKNVLGNDLVDGLLGVPQTTV